MTEQRQIFDAGDLQPVEEGKSPVDLQPVEEGRSSVDLQSVEEGRSRVDLQPVEEGRSRVGPDMSGFPVSTARYCNQCYGSGSKKKQKKTTYQIINKEINFKYFLIFFFGSRATYFY